eukprot:TRINITY_DN5022_c0_g1_i1.p1 TRINITY_DN5022_c0_g1~~TRINITY_DN5022_c0_g1_i1.p1  ORF type:complete len:109 (-),score=18.24 TRINITY_DN5022_c0_g1_i1:81-407(-)
MGNMCKKESNDEPNEKNTVKLITIGTAGSGKSTFAKQMKILHCNGFREEEMDNYKRILFSNVVTGFKEIGMNLNLLDRQVEDAEEEMNYFMNVSLKFFQIFYLFFQQA